MLTEISSNERPVRDMAACLPADFQPFLTRQCIGQRVTPRLSFWFYYRFTACSNSRMFVECLPCAWVSRTLPHLFHCMCNASYNLFLGLSVDGERLMIEWPNLACDSSQMLQKLCKTSFMKCFGLVIALVPIQDSVKQFQCSKALLKLYISPQ